MRSTPVIEWLLRLRHSLEERELYNLARGMVLTRAKPRDCLAVENERLSEVPESLECASRLS